MRNSLDMMPSVFRKRFSFGDAPAGWKPVNVALDWSGSPLLLMVEGKGDEPSFTEKDPEAWSRWYRTPPKAHHVVYWVGDTLHTLLLEHAQGISSFHIQRFQNGWLLGERRGGRTVAYDRHGKLTSVFDLGDASQDLQTTPDGKIWVSYFDEGVFGGGIGNQGVVCFDTTGLPIFRFAEFAEKHGLPMICDCYAMNVTATDEIWLNYYTDFPLVRLRNFSLDHVWPSFCAMGDGFAIKGAEALYLRNDRLMSSSLDLPFGEPQEAICVDEEGNSLDMGQRRTHNVGRGSSLAVDTGTGMPGRS